MFIAWLLILTYNGIILEDYSDQVLKTFSRGIIIGTIAGIIIGFIELLPYYIRKQWDLHIVVPYFLLIHLIISMLGILVLQFIEKDSTLRIGYILGIILGGLFAIIAYIGEIRVEHTDKDEPALLD